MAKIKLFFVTVGSAALNLWGRLPAWVRSTVYETLELAFAIAFSYMLAVGAGEVNFDFMTLVTLVVKACVKALRANPNIPLKDYVNDVK